MPITAELVCRPISPKAGTFATGYKNIEGTEVKLQIWSLSNGNLLNNLTGFGDVVSSMAMLQNGNMVSGSYDNKIRIWDTDFSLVKTITLTRAIVGLAILTTGDFLAADYDRNITFWSQDGVLKKEIKTPHTMFINQIISLKTGEFLTASMDKTIIYWKADGTVIKTLTSHTASVTGLAELNNGELLFSVTVFPNNYIAVGTYGGNVKLIDTAGNVVNTLVAHPNAPTLGLLFVENFLITAAVDRTCKVWTSS